MTHEVNAPKSNILMVRIGVRCMSFLWVRVLVDTWVGRQVKNLKWKSFSSLGNKTCPSIKLLTKLKSNLRKSSVKNKS